MSKSRLKSGVTSILLFAGFVSAPLFAASDDVDPYANPPSPAFEGQTGAPVAETSEINVEVVASDLQLPRSLVALPDGNLVVAQGDGLIKVISADGSSSHELGGVPAIRSMRGRSLNDFALDYNFSENRMVYLTYQAPPAGQAGGPATPEQAAAAAESGSPFQIPKITRARLSEDNSHLENVEVIAEIAGRRLISAPDDILYVTTMGYGEERPEVQDLSLLTGKVLRLNSDGSVPDDNPFVNHPDARPEIFAYGHRDPDGAFIHPVTHELWTIEHGPMGGDELNAIQRGENNGWPLITYGKNYDGTEVGPSSDDGLEQPLYYWFPSVAPSGLMMYSGSMFPEWKGNVFVGTMSPTQGKFLVRLKMKGEKVIAEEHLLVDNDRRVRAMTQAADGAVYVLTDSEDNNQTNRHYPGEVLRLTPQ